MSNDAIKQNCDFPPFFARKFFKICGKKQKKYDEEISLAVE